MEMFRKLKSYKRYHKNTSVPRTYKKNPQLGEWVHTQRSRHKDGKMPPIRIRMLKSIDFCFTRLEHRGEERWMEIFQKLVAYKGLHKTTVVPRKYKEDPHLYFWVNSQRSRHNDGKMKPNRIALLN